MTDPIVAAFNRWRNAIVDVDEKSKALKKAKDELDSAEAALRALARPATAR